MLLPNPNFNYFSWDVAVLSHFSLHGISSLIKMQIYNQIRVMNYINQ